MAKRFRWPAWAGILHNQPPKSPWGGGGKGDGGSISGGSGDDADGDSGGAGPRNPWNFPPEGRRSRPSGPGPLDELLRRARRGGGGGGGGGLGLPGGGFGGRMWAWIAGGLVLVFILYTSIHQIRPQERGVVTFLGSYSGTLEPGIRLTMPAPFVKVEKVDIEGVKEEAFPESGNENLMITGDQNIVDISYKVQWRITDAADFVFQIARPQETVRAVAESAMRAVVATATLNDTIGAGRSRIAAQVQIMMQDILDEYHSGVRIQSVSIENARPPEKVDDAFKQVTAAQQEAEGNKNNARAYAQQVIAAAEGQAAEFDKIYEQYRQAPQVTRTRLYYETMEAVLGNNDKVVIEAPGVTPYLPLPGVRRSAEPVPEAPKPGGAK